MSSRRSKKPKQGARLKMADIARLAGVDVSTVSRALSDSPRLPMETKRRITEIVRETGYVVNQGAKMLRSRQAGQILLILPNIAASFYPEVVQGIEEVTAARGINVLVGSTRRDPERERELGRQLLTGMADGLILLTGHVPDTVLELPDFQRRIIAVSRPVDGIDVEIACVSIDNRAATRAAMEHLYSLGHRKILHIGGSRSSPVFRARASAYSDFMKRKGIGDLTCVKRFEQFDIRSGLSHMAELLSELADWPTAVLCASDELAIGAISAARAAGLRVPQDISFVGFDDMTVAAVYEPPLTTIRIPRREIGRVGAEMLLASLDPSNPDPTNVELPFELIVRKSTGPVLGSSSRANSAPRTKRNQKTGIAAALSRG